MDKRNFLIRAFQALVAVFGLSLINSKVLAKDRDDTKKVKMLTQDGKLVWVDKSRLDSTKVTDPISNKKLLSWLKPK